MHADCVNTANSASLFLCALIPCNILVSFAGVVSTFRNSECWQYHMTDWICISNCCRETLIIKKLLGCQEGHSGLEGIDREYSENCYTF